MGNKRSMIGLGQIDWGGMYTQANDKGWLLRSKNNGICRCNEQQVKEILKKGVGYDAYVKMAQIYE